VARILVIDDSTTVARSVQDTLRRSGHTVDLLGCFVELPSYLRQSPPDLILLDLEMPAFSGLDFGQFIRRHGERRFPIVIHSSRPLSELRKAASQIDAVDVFEKGRRGDDLVTAVNRVLAQGSVAAAR
jgi:DNA-binding response OmpR family regulator